ncbi:type VI secretion system contractile sheath large subunit [Pelomonas sp. P7]|uniref:Type VI secretion system contractile sheath large subunit n=1 Tax=Pelomonas caseinilytica TaxID=2906763 RepID=A0ABS8XB12_9BURK|nr:type VI secretion system contractile sheath large subunit [Pelomonas sp. P7]MCE4538121.1 type VI secretion system contractile sheath large subunit [Pelomonas sp. P7]
MAHSDWTPDYGTLDAAAPPWAAKRPVRIALLGDFGAGAAAGRLDTGSDLARHKPKSVEFDSLEDWLGQQDLTLTLPIGSKRGGVQVPLADLESFHPDTLFRELDLFRKLADLRKRLNNTATFDKAAAEVAKMAGIKKKASRAGRGARARGAAPAAGARLDDFARLTGRTSAPEAGGIDALLRDVVGPFVVPAAKPEKAGLLNALDAAIADGMRAVLHQADFQAAESLWRGVDFLLRRLETGPMLQVHLIDVSAEEFAADLSSGDDLTDTGLYKLLVEQPSQAKDGGYTYIAGLYEFEATPPHTELLGRMAKVAEAAGAGFFTAMAVDDLANPKKPPHPLVAEAFTALQALPEARRLSLLGPRFLLRHPYGKRSDPISSFAFEEFTLADGLSGMLWGHPALLALTVLAGQGGTPTVNDLPFHHYVDADGDSTALPCTERFISTVAVSALARWGVGALVAHKGEPSVRLAGLAGFTAAGAASKAGARAGIEMSLKSKLAEADARPARRGTATDDDSPSDADEAIAGLDDAGTSSDGDAGTDDLDALLASLGGSDDGDASGSDDQPGEGDASAAADDADMDPELAELLKSLG